MKQKVSLDICQLELKLDDKKEVKIIWCDDHLAFQPIHNCLLDELVTTVKTIENNQVIKETLEVYVIQKQNGVDTCITQQGFLDKICLACIKNRIQYTLIDRRVADYAKGFPKPNYRFLGDLRFTQADLIKKALDKNKNGIICAPTRFGKSYMIANIIKVFPTLRTCLVAPGIDLVGQLYEDMRKLVPNRDIKLLKGATTEADVLVCSVDSLHKVDTSSIELLICDEPHALVSTSRLPKIDAFSKARRYALSATPTGRFDGKDICTVGCFGPILSEVTYKEAVDMGAIAPLVVLYLHIPVAKDAFFFNRNRAYDSLVFNNKAMAILVDKISTEIIPSDWQTIIFVKTEKQANLMMSYMRESTLAMAKKLSKSEREDLTERMRNDTIKRCLATRIYIQGVTFHQLRCLINCEGGGNNTSAIQKPGRLAEKIEGKNHGIIIDFTYDIARTSSRNAVYTLKIDSENRRKAYQEKGYTIVDCYSLEDLKEKFNNFK